MPSSSILFLGSLAETSVVFVEFFVKLRINSRNLGVGDAVAFALTVKDWVDVEAAGGRFAGGEAEALDEFFLEVGRKIVLGAEKDYASLGDWENLLDCDHGGRRGGNY